MLRVFSPSVQKSPVILMYVVDHVHISYHTEFVDSVGVRYFIPASMYSIYNVLTYHSLRRFNPGTYFVSRTSMNFVACDAFDKVLLQSRIIITAVLSHFFGVSKQRPSPLQWTALILIMIGSMLKEATSVYEVFLGDVFS